jgi:hypothetical protein
MKPGVDADGADRKASFPIASDAAIFGGFVSSRVSFLSVASCILPCALFFPSGAH